MPRHFRFGCPQTRGHEGVIATSRRVREPCAQRVFAWRDDDRESQDIRAHDISPAAQIVAAALHESGASTGAGVATFLAWLGR
jgi:hypothetical protein